jgi:serine/threonine-protein kinase
VSAPLRAVVQRALRVSPDERFATAADMRDALRACLSRWGQPYGRQEALAELRELVEETEAARRELGMTEDDLVPHALRG